jgi:hypothetical protein
MVLGIKRGVFRSWHSRRNGAALIALTLFLMACGAAIGRSQTPTASPAQAASSARLAACRVGTSGADETASWVTYLSPVYGYCMKYPASWVVERFSTDEQPAFGSEESGGPLELSPNGIYFYILTTNSSSADCPRTNVGVGQIDSQAPVKVAGVSGTKYLTTYEGVAIVVNVWRGRCYDFFFAVGAGARDSYSHVIDLILGTFSFGS